MQSVSAILQSLKNSHCSKTRYKMWLPRVCYTEGVKEFAEAAEAFWLLDIILSYQASPRLKTEAMFDQQIWKLRVSETGKAIVTCRAYNSNKPVIKQTIPVTDFPVIEEDIVLYCRGAADSPNSKPYMVIMLPSEN